MTVEEVHSKLAAVDDFRALVTNNPQIDDEDADTLKRIISGRETDVIRNFLNLPDDEHHFRAVVFAETLADLLLEDVEDADIVEHLVTTITDLRAAIERMSQTMPVPDISGVIREAIAQVNAQVNQDSTPD